MAAAPACFASFSIEGDTVTLHYIRSQRARAD
jgi:hypothetical protein